MLVRLWKSGGSTLFEALLEVEHPVDHRGNARSRPVPCNAFTLSYGAPQPHGVHAVLGIAAAFPGSVMLHPPARAGRRVWPARR